jgi:aryl-alcohol dehydrogenase-like predicted oxidoreductase
MGDDKGGAKPDYVAAACEASLGRLGTDRIDLYQLHFPDQNTPIDDTLGALDQLVRDGKVREIGCSNFSGEQIDAAEASSGDRGLARFVSAQNQLNLLNQRGKDDLVAACERHNLGILPYFPLASGLLTGKYDRNAAPPEGTPLAGMPEERRDRIFSDKNFDLIDALTAFASKRDRTLLDLAFAWLTGLPQMASVIAGATKGDQVAANVAAAEWKLSDDEMAEIGGLTA